MLFSPLWRGFFSSHLKHLNIGINGVVVHIWGYFMFRKICYKTLMLSIKWGNHDDGSKSTPKDVAWPVVTLCQECDGPSKKWFEGRSRKSSGFSENKFHLFWYCCISGTMVCLRRPLPLLVVLTCCCLLNIVGLTHSFIHSVKEGECLMYVLHSNTIDLWG